MNTTNKILEYLKKGNSITPLEALEKFGTIRLGARIYELRQRGYNIKTIREQKGIKWYARYVLVEDKKPPQK